LTQQDGKEHCSQQEDKVIQELKETQEVLEILDHKVLKEQ
jgi:hypothetical protein